MKFFPWSSHSGFFHLALSKFTFPLIMPLIFQLLLKLLSYPHKNSHSWVSKTASIKGSWFKIQASSWPLKAEEMFWFFLSHLTLRAAGRSSKTFLNVFRRRKRFACSKLTVHWHISFLALWEMFNLKWQKVSRRRDFANCA